MRLNVYAFTAFIFLFFFSSVTLHAESASYEKLPDDIRYMLEDMYGANKTQWPGMRSKRDINQDGFLDWVVSKKCALNKKCSHELFICIPAKEGQCSEYCYIEVKTLDNIEKTIHSLKCESTC